VYIYIYIYIYINKQLNNKIIYRFFAGQVHRARLNGQEVVIKVQRPGLKELFDIDLKNLRVNYYYCSIPCFHFLDNEIKHPGLCI
jgi:hypothetical protein